MGRRSLQEKEQKEKLILSPENVQEKAKSYSPYANYIKNVSYDETFPLAVNLLNKLLDICIEVNNADMTMNENSMFLTNRESRFSNNDENIFNTLIVEDEDKWWLDRYNWNQSKIMDLLQNCRLDAIKYNILG